MIIFLDSALDLDACIAEHMLSGLLEQGSATNKQLRRQTPYQIRTGAWRNFSTSMAKCLHVSTNDGTAPYESSIPGL